MPSLGWCWDLEVASPCDYEALFHSSAPMASDSWGWAGVDALAWSWGMAASGLEVNWVKAQLLGGLTGEVGWKKLRKPQHLQHLHVGAQY